MTVETAGRTRTRWPIALGLFGAGFALVGLAWSGENRCDGATLAPLLIASIVLGGVAARLPGAAVSLLPGVLLPSWSICGPDQTAVVAFVGALAGGGLLGGMLPGA